MKDLVVDNAFAFDAVEAYSDVILRIAFQYVRNRQDAEDLMQDVFLSMLNQRSFSDAEHLKAWLIRVTINKSKNFVKAAKRKRAAATESVSYAFNETDKLTLAEINKLPPTDRNILYLFYVEGCKAKEIGELIGKKENAVHARLKRAREKLKTILED